MLSLFWPWVLAAAPLPVLVAALAPRAPDAAGAPIRVPFFEAARQFSALGVGSSRKRRMAAAVLAWLLLVTAGARPQWIGDPIPLPVTGRDLLLAVDLSGSMREQDMKRGSGWESRLETVKRVASEFIARREGDRIGLILFGSRAYLQAPLTLDRDTVDEMLRESLPGLAGEQTAIGDAVGLAVKRLRERPAANRVLILLTDGADTASEVSPEKSAEYAAREGITIYAIGVGADEVVIRRWFGAQGIPRRTSLDEGTLKHMASITGGRYFRARDGRELENIYELIDALEPVSGDDEVFRPTAELFHWPLGLAALIFGTLGLASVLAGLDLRAILASSRRAIRASGRV